MTRLLNTAWFFALLLCACKGYGQSKLIDSLNRAFKVATDTQKVNVLNKLSSAYWYSDALMTIKYARQSIALATQLEFDPGIAAGYNNIGVGYYQQNKYDSAVAWYNKALEIHKRTANFRGEGFVLSNIGLIYWKQGLFTQSVEHYLRSLKIWQQHQLEAETSGIYENLGNVYNEQGDFDRALTSYQKAVTIQKKYNKTAQEQSMTLSNIGTAYLGKGQPKEALRYFNESLNFLDEEEKESRAVSLSNIGITYIDLKDYINGKEYLTKALKLQEETGDNDGMVHTLLGLGQVYQASGELNTAKQYADRALSISEKIADISVLEEVWLLLSEIAAGRGDFRNAYSYYKNYTVARDSVKSKENIYNIAHLQAGIEDKRNRQRSKGRK